MLGPADLRNRQNLPSLSHRQKRRIKKHLRDPRGKRRAVFAPRRPRMRARGTGKAPEETTAEIPELGKRRKPGLQEARRMPYRVDPERVTGSQVQVLRPQHVHVEGRPRGAGGSGVSGLTGEARERYSLPASPPAWGHVGGQRSERTPASGTTSNGRPPCAP